ncbi:hypothetical protein RESH_02121 [Rhodopirellula europaea SH398]|uniref:Uncharacterized protein n=1 Tax=Rhodopirellula europaea SH398 TaxID=1263868 RepID=M5S731_9BACT|nr:hypothetical protein RESH_02121 [Rhodopirellula europaea SH398]MCR9207659.1 hypothetical protein [bacterium]
MGPSKFHADRLTSALTLDVEPVVSELVIERRLEKSPGFKRLSEEPK